MTPNVRRPPGGVPNDRQSFAKSPESTVLDAQARRRFRETCGPAIASQAAEVSMILSALGASLFGLLAVAPAPATLVTPATGNGVYDFELRRVADGVYVAVRPDVFRQPVEGNLTFIVNADDVVVVDAGGTQASAESAIKLLRSVTDKPVRYLVNTHWHGDHNLGNAAFRRAWPGVEIVAHPNTVAAMTASNIDLDNLPRQLTETLAALRRGIETGKDEQGQPLPADRLERWKKMVPDLETSLAETRRTRIVRPTLSVSDSLALTRGEREIHVRYLGRGNTEGDLVVWLPKERIVMSGDLVVHPQPYGFWSHPTEWIRALDALAALDYRYLIPGHGEVQQDTAYVRHLQALIGKVRDQAAAAVKVGATLEQVRERLDLGELETVFTAGDARRKFLLKAWFLDPFSISAYKEAQGEPILQGQR
jgi:glyoxylase-like metal-dependent hydrolase (beta-lactamase superfamily II)